MLPRRVNHSARAIQKYGAVATALFSHLDKLDPPADDLISSLRGPEALVTQAMVDDALVHGVSDETPAPLRSFVRALEVIPSWVDWGRLERGQRVLMRSGLLGGIVLGARSLIYGYAAPAGNKPLVFSGRLEVKAKRRLAETSRFVQAVLSHGGMRRRGDGFLITARVRLMHAQVRRLILETGRWDEERWGGPINQHDMLATVLLFSSVWVQGLRRFGLHVTRQEADDVIHLWRYVGHVIGVEEALLPDTEAEALQYQRCIEETQGPPDEDSIKLVRSLLDIRLRLAKNAEEEAQARKMVRVAEGFCRGLLGDDLADQLRLSRTGWRWIVPSVKALVQPFEQVRQHCPAFESYLHQRGSAYWSHAVDRDLREEPATFARPRVLFGA